jgi:hypothetical protein
MWENSLTLGGGDIGRWLWGKKYKKGEENKGENVKEKRGKSERKKRKKGTLKSKW